MRVLRRLVLVAAVAAVAASLPARAQVQPVYDLGAAGLLQVLERLQTTASVLHTGAHPDDEDSSFIARTARGDHARVAYLSLTRGEGGQNFIGTELFDALGVIRSEELRQARRLDGGEQFFTRAIDFGFSKTRTETAAKWNEREVLDDMVRVIRTFRPLVVVSRFSGTAADGHGHHQLAGYLTPLAFRAAASRAEFPHHFAEGLRPWQASKLYRSVRQANEPGLLEVVTGVFDHAIGRTYGEIAAEGRSQHKSQEMGAIESRAELRSLLRLEQIAGPDGVRTADPVALDERTPFDGIDVSIAGIAAIAGLPGGALRQELEAVASAAQRALDEYDPLRPAAIVPVLAEGLQATRAARERARSGAWPADAKADADHLLSFKEKDFGDALARAAGVVIDALAAQETVPQGGTVAVSVRAFYPQASGGEGVRVTGAGLRTPDGWAVTPAEAAIPGAERSPFSREFSVAVPATAAVTQPYFLDTPRDGDRYAWTGDDPKAEPFAEGPLVGWVTLDIGGASVTLDRRVDYRFADRVRGEIRRTVNVVPAVTASLDSPLLIVPLGTAPSVHRVTVTATSHAAGRQVDAVVRLQLPPGWTSAPADAKVTLTRAGDRASTPFVVTAPPTRRAGPVAITATAAAGGSAFSRDVQVVAYPHIDTHRIYRPASLTAQVVDLKVAPVRVGYVMGTGDQVPEALRRMGLAVTVLDDAALAGDLSAFDTIVVGVRASEARPDFVNEHRRLMQYVTAGGTLVVQYQQTDYVARDLPPYVPAQPGGGNSRVTDETAAVRILAPGHAVFTFPNRITPADFDGWVQERNLYAFPVVDPRYTPLLETADPGEPPQRGGEVYARVGKGHYVYTAYSWFRQLPAGVPGAYRQFANLVSLSKAPQ